MLGPCDDPKTRAFIGELLSSQTSPPPPEPYRCKTRCFKFVSTPQRGPTPLSSRDRPPLSFHPSASLPSRGLNVLPLLQLFQDAIGLRHSSLPSPFTLFSLIIPPSFPYSPLTFLAFSRPGCCIPLLIVAYCAPPLNNSPLVPCVTSVPLLFLLVQRVFHWCRGGTMRDRCPRASVGYVG